MIGVKEETIQGEDVLYDCPICNEKGIVAETRSVDTALTLLVVLPLIVQKRTELKCTSCGKRRYVDIDLKYIHRYSPDELCEMVEPPWKVAASALAFCSLLVSILPIIAIVLIIPSFVMNRKRKGWQRVATYVAICIQLLVLAFLFLGFLVDTFS
ncbi:hypothetical protein KS4_32970 [Poriferisphaera corsica]|uniref:Uncharacterized protein n=1 Tax=Poriferisphaera corsica TaxID=2528020 RepID=A0A517YYD8_9BACT|nr:hypothetical protein [Poriferisphaera corsica]QDU35217.1 hypothetical protein KS4_32970 [Poriferisphaera corsica]